MHCLQGSARTNNEKEIYICPEGTSERITQPAKQPCFLTLVTTPIISLSASAAHSLDTAAFAKPVTANA